MNDADQLRLVSQAEEWARLKGKHAKWRSVYEKAREGNPVADSVAMATEAITRKKPVRRVFGRLRVKAADDNYIFELTKAGLMVHRRNSRRRRDVLVSFDRLIACGRIEEKIDGIPHKFAMVRGKGVEMKVLHDPSKLVSFSMLADFINGKPVLIP